MNNNLPPEILHFIFIRLPLRDRITCTLVCRHWYRALQKRSLLYDLEISRQQRLDKLIDLLHRLPSRGNQVEILEVEDTVDFDRRKFCNMFPNMRVFLNLNVGYSNDNFIPSFEFVNPDSKLEEIGDHGYCEVTLQLLASARCNQLRILDINLERIDDPRSSFFPLLNNLPALERFSVNGYAFGILDFEMVHENVPSIKQLQIKMIRTLDDQMPATITPAAAVTHLEIEFNEDDTDDEDDEDDAGVDLHSHVRFYEYLGKKYTHLTKFIHNDDLMNNYAQINLSTQIYQKGLLPLYRNIGNRLKHLEVKSAPDAIGLFDELDSFGCQLQRVNFNHNYKDLIFSQFAQSLQSKCVKKVSVKNTVIVSPSLLSNMTSLRSIRIGSRASKSIDLTEYMDAFPPSLTELQLKCSQFKISDSPTLPTNIKTLFIGCPVLPNTLGQTISTYFPKLTRISIRGDVTENMKLHLPNNHLKSLDIAIHHKKYGKKYGFLLKYTNGMHTLCFVERPSLYNNADPTIEFGTIKELENRTVIEVECASTNNVTLKTYHNYYRGHYY